MQPNNSAAFRLGVGVGMFAIVSASASAYPSPELNRGFSRLPDFLQPGQNGVTLTPPIIPVEDWSTDIHLANFSDNPVELLSGSFFLADPAGLLNRLDRTTVSFDHLDDLVEE